MISAPKRHPRLKRSAAFIAHFSQIQFVLHCFSSELPKEFDAGNSKLTATHEIERRIRWTGLLDSHIDAPNVWLRRATACAQPTSRCELVVFPHKGAGIHGRGLEEEVVCRGTHGMFVKFPLMRFCRKYRV